MALANPTKTIHAWLWARVRAVCGDRARLGIVSQDWVDKLEQGNQRVDSEWGLAPRTVLSSVDDLCTSRAVLGYVLTGAWSGSGVSRDLEWTDKQIRLTTSLQRSILTTDPPEGVDGVESGEINIIDRAGLVAWEIPVAFRCGVED